MVKIDRSFVIRMTDGHRDQAVVQAVLHLADAFAMDVIAEGVETQDQRQLLVDLGCERVQGFLFSRPVVPTRGLPAARRGHLAGLNGQRRRRPGRRCCLGGACRFAGCFFGAGSFASPRLLCTVRPRTMPTNSSVRGSSRSLRQARRDLRLLAVDEPPHRDVLAVVEPRDAPRHDDHAGAGGRGLDRLPGRPVVEQHVGQVVPG